MSTILVDNLTGKTSAGSITVTSEGGAATQSLQQGLAKAWVNFNGTGTIAARDSLNVSGLVDNSTGDYTVTMASAMGNANYCYTALGGDTSGSLSVRIENPSNRTTTTIDLLAYNTSSTQIDMQDMNTLFHGDLA